MSMMLRGICVVVVMLAGLSAPAFAQDVSGTWEMAVELDVGGGEPTFVFTQDGETLSGIYEGTFGDAEVAGTLRGDQIEFWFEVQGTKATYMGTVTDDTMEGTCDYGDVGSGTWEGEKVE